MDIITMHLVFIKYVCEYKDFIIKIKYISLLAPPKILNPWLGGQEFYNLGRGLHGHYNHTFRFYIALKDGMVIILQLYSYYPKDAFNKKS